MAWLTTAGLLLQPAQAQSPTPPVCDRTSQVQQAILATTAATACANVTSAHLSGITAMEIRNQNLAALKIGDFSGMSSLAALNLSDNILSSLPVGVFNGLSALNTLALSDNRLTGLSSGVFSGLSNLQSLYLSDNLLTSIPIGVFTGLSSLQALHLNDNNLGTLAATLFDPLVKLKTLHLYDAGLTQLQAMQFSRLRALQTLTLYGNQLSGSNALQAGTFSGLSALQTLQINESLLTNLPTGIFAGLSELQALDLSDNLLTALPALTGLVQLQQLNLSDNSISMLADGAFTGLNALRQLNLNSNQLTSIPSLSALSNLEHLFLGDNQIDLEQQRTSPFTGLSRLKRLHLQFNATETPYDGSALIGGSVSLIGEPEPVQGDSENLPEGFFTGLGQLQEVFLHCSNKHFVDSINDQEACPAFNLKPEIAYGTAASELAVRVPSAVPFDLPVRVGTDAGGLQSSNAQEVVIPAGETGKTFTQKIPGASIFAQVSVAFFDRFSHARFTGIRVAKTPTQIFMPAQTVVFSQGQEIEDLLYTAGLSIPGETLPEAWTPQGQLTYSLTATTSDGTLDSSSLPQGLTFTRATRTLTGTPAAAGTYSMTYTATDASSHAVSLTFSIVVSAAVSFPSGTTAPDQTYTSNTAIAPLALPAITAGTGTAPVKYSLVATTNNGQLQNNLPAGLIFDDTTRTLAGTPTADGSYDMDYSATDANGSSATLEFTVTVSTLLRFASGTTVPDQTYTKDTAIESLLLPQALGGSGDLTYSLAATTMDGTLAGNLPAGLSFAALTRTLTGTPTVAGTYSMEYRVEDTSNTMVKLTFMVTVSAPVSFSGTTLMARNYTSGTAITSLQLAAATGGTSTMGTLDYSLIATTSNGTLDGSLPAGLSFDAASRTLTGTPTAAGTYSMDYSATDDNGSSDKLTFTLTVNAAVSFSGTTLPDKNYPKDTAISDLQLAAATGGTGTLSYSLAATFSNGTLDGSLPAGLSFAGSTRTLTGTPTAAGTYKMRYSAADTNGSSDAQTFIIRVSGSSATLEFANNQSIDDQTYSQNIAIQSLELPFALGGTGDLTYSLATTMDGTLNGNLPAGLSFAAATRTLSGTPTAEGTYSMEYTATDSSSPASTASLTFTLTVSGPVRFPSGTTLQNKAYTQNTAIVSLQLTPATGGTGELDYSLSATTSDGALVNNLPSGLSFDDDSRTLTGTPVAAGTYGMEYTAKDKNGSTATLTFNVTVNAAVSFSSGATVLNQNYTKDILISTLSLPAIAAGTGTSPVSYDLVATATGIQLQNSLPAGLSFDDTNRTLTGTPTTEGTYSMEYTATDANGSEAMLTFTLTVSGSVSFATSLSDRIYTQGAFSSLQLPMAIGGAPPVNYTLTATTSDGMLDGDLPEGLDFTAARQLLGTPTTAGTYDMEYTATDDNGSEAVLTFTLTVSTAVSFAAGVVLQPQNYTRNIAISDLELPEAGGGTGLLTYGLTASTLDGQLQSNQPAGLSFNSDERMLSGTPTVAGTYAMAYTATDGNGSTARLIFTLTVSEEVRFAADVAVENQSYTKDTSISPLNLPEATGGTGLLIYSLTAATSDGTLDGTLPAGLSFDDTNRILQGTPTAAGTYDMTYSAADANGSTAMLAFTIEVASMQQETFAQLETEVQQASVLALLAVSSQSIGHRLGLFASGNLYSSNISPTSLSFKLPLQSDEANPNPQNPLVSKDASEGVSLWIALEESRLSNRADLFDWSGATEDTQLGFDGQISDNLMLGLLINQSEGKFNYRGLKEEQQGLYRTSLQSIHPYLGWISGSGNIRLWTTLGQGDGESEIIGDRGELYRSDFSFNTVSVGLSYQNPDHLKNPLSWQAELSFIDQENRPEAGSSTSSSEWQIRLMALIAPEFRTQAGDTLSPELRLGLKENSYANKLGSGLEIGAGLNYTSASGRLILELGGHSLQAEKENYRENGSYMLLKWRFKPNGRGPSISLQPARGNAASGEAQNIWEGLDNTFDAVNPYVDEDWRLESELSWGLALGVAEWTPYFRFNGRENSENIALGWRATFRLNLGLSLEVRETRDTPDSQALNLSGQLRF